METPDELPIVGPWARDKLTRLGKYLAAYTAILRQRAWCEGFYFVDAFAGAGQAKIRTSDTTPGSGFLFSDLREDADARQVVDGSPRVALKLQHPFSRYFFVELDPERRKHLEALRAEFPTRSIEVIGEDCNSYLWRFVAQHEWKTHRGVVFLDPFGMQVPWATLEQIARTRALEVFINFPMGMAINRALPNDGRFEEADRRRRDEYFGDPAWYDVVYKARQEGRELFEEAEAIAGVVKVEQAGDRLVDWYRGRLGQAFGYVSSPYLVKNSSGGHLYYLIHAGPNQTGAKIAEEVLKGGRPLGPAKGEGKPVRSTNLSLFSSEKTLPVCRRCGSAMIGRGQGWICQTCRDEEPEPEIASDDH